MGRLLTFVVVAFAFVLFTVTLTTAQNVDPDETSITNELGTPCALLATPDASPNAGLDATPEAVHEATPGATPEAIVLPGCPTGDATPTTQ